MFSLAVQLLEAHIIGVLFLTLGHGRVIACIMDCKSKTKSSSPEKSEADHCVLLLADNREVEVDAFLHRFLTDKHREEPTLVILHDEVAKTLGADLGDRLAGVLLGGVGLGGGHLEFAVHVGISVVHSYL